MKNPIQLIDAFFRKPLLIDQSALRMVIAAMNARMEIPAHPDAYGGSKRSSVVVRGAIAVVPVLGILTYRSMGYFSWLFGDTSYEEIRENFRQAMADAAVSAVVFDVASPGGTAEAIFDLIDEIFQMRGTKPMYAIVNETATSAAYAIASAADKVYIPRLGRVGSIGVRMVHIDESAADEMAGLKYTEIYEGNQKNAGTSHAPLSPETLASYRAMIGQHMDVFVETIARNRGLKAADVRSQESAIYTGKDAVTSGLADAVLSWDGAWKKIMGVKTSQGGSMKSKLQALFAEQSKETVAAALLELGYVPKMEGSVLFPVGAIPPLAAALGIDSAQLSGDLTKVDFTKLGMATVASAVSAAEAKTRKETLAYVQTIHEMCALGGQEKMAPALIKEEVEVEDARAKVLAEKAKGSNRTEIRSTIGATTADGPNPLLADAKKRAGVRETKQ